MLPVLAPAAANEPDRIREAVRALHEFRKGKRLGRLKLRKMMDEGQEGRQWKKESVFPKAWVRAPGPSNQSS
ncbi:MAG: hypothetical protein WA005_06545 [Candidatus Binataceae bacterium]